MVDTHVKKRKLGECIYMNKETLLKLGLSEEQVTSVLDSYKQSLEGFVPKHRFDEVNTSKNDLTEQLKQRDEQLTKLSEIDADSLKKEISSLQEVNKTASEQYAKQVLEMQYNYELDKSLTGARVRNSKAVQALLDKDTIKFNEGKFTGLQEQLDNLKGSDPYLFVADEAPVQTEVTTPKPFFSNGEHNPPPQSDGFLSAFKNKK